MQIPSDFWHDEALSSLSPAAHLLAAALLGYADEEGNFSANPALVKAACFPLRDLPIPALLEDLNQSGFLNLDPERRTGTIPVRAAKGEAMRPIAEAARASYNKIMAKPNGLLKKCSIINPSRMRAVAKALPTVRAICRELGMPVKPAFLATPEFWDRYFEEAAADDWYSGRTKGGPGHENWKPGFEYLMHDYVMVKLFDNATTKA